MRNRYGEPVHWKVDQKRGGKVRSAIYHITLRWADELEIHARRRRSRTEAIAKLRYTVGLYRHAARLEATLVDIDAEHQARLKNLLDQAAEVIGCDRSLLHDIWDIREAGNEIWGYGRMR